MFLTELISFNFVYGSKGSCPSLHLLSTHDPPCGLKSAGKALLKVRTAIYVTEGGWAIAILAPMLWNALGENVPH